jgi:hypothetical protein
MADQTLAFDWAASSAARSTAPGPAREKTLAERFQDFHRANPQVWDLFDRFAWELARAGSSRLSAKLIFERIRWETTLATRGEPWRVNNSYSAFYARLWMARYPDASASFETRVQRAEAG